MRKSYYQNLRYAGVIVGAVLTGATLFVLSFVVLDFVWTHVLVTNPKEVDLGDGVMVVGAGFVIGCTLGIGGVALFLYKFWPRRSQP